MTNPYIRKLNELIADINENEIASHDNPKSLKCWCEKWREEATMCSIALFTELSRLNEISDEDANEVVAVDFYRNRYQTKDGKWHEGRIK